MMVQQNLILILLLWCSGAEAPFKILLRWNSAKSTKSCIFPHEITAAITTTVRSGRMGTFQKEEMDEGTMISSNR